MTIALIAVMNTSALILATLLAGLGSVASANDQNRGGFSPTRKEQEAYKVHGTFATSRTGDMLVLRGHGFAPHATKVTAHKTGYGHMLIDNKGRVSVVPN